jgi:hypothetical protein
MDGGWMDGWWVNNDRNPNDYDPIFPFDVICKSSRATFKKGFLEKDI